MAGPNGGARPNSGPKKGAKYAKTISKELAREVVREYVMQHMPAMIEAQVAHSKGLKYLVIRDPKTGKFKKITQEKMDAMLEEGNEDELDRLEIWEKEPSVPAFTDLMNRTLDKPAEQKQVLEITGELSMVLPRLVNGRKRISGKV